MSNYICTNRGESYRYHVKEVLEKSRKEILNFFELDNETKFNFNVYIYDSKEELVAGLRQRGFKKDPDYMCACQKDEDNSLNFYEPKDHSEKDWSKEDYDQVIFHEEVHGITFNIYGQLPEYITEGIATYLDGSYKKDIKFLLDNYIHKNIIPSMDELEYEFGKHEYDSYDYAYLIVSYLIETLGKKEFLSLIGNKERLEQIKSTLVVQAIMYYNEKYYGNKYYNAKDKVPQFLFHGSQYLIDVLKLSTSHDSHGNKDNIATAVFLTPSFLISSAYAFKDQIKENSKGMDWNFKVQSTEIIPIMTMENVVINEEIEGYIYVFLNTNKIKKDKEDSLQYKSFEEVKPIDCIKISYKKFKEYYLVKEKDKKYNI